VLLGFWFFERKGLQKEEEEEKKGRQLSVALALLF
jgi:hypothetical protein